MIAVDYKLNFDPESLDSINALHERTKGCSEQRHGKTARQARPNLV